MMKRGIDVSVFQKGLNLSEVKRQGYDFIIIRAGYTGYGTGIDYHKDEMFEEFYRQAKAVGLSVGAYWYSCANTYDKGVAEALFMYNNCLKGKMFEYPICIDVEDEHHQLTSKYGTSQAIKGFCETLENLGYYVSVYANTNWFNNNIDLNLVSPYDKWIAQWSEKEPNTPFNYGIWQNSSSAYISGVNVDTNISYIEYDKIMLDKNLNGYNKNTLKLNEEIATEVIAGLWGNGDDRYKRLTEAGYDYNTIQAIINSRFKTPKKSNEEIATEVIAGLWGNGDDRYKRLTEAGYDYNTIQAIVNSRY